MQSVRWMFRANWRRLVQKSFSTVAFGSGCMMSAQLVTEVKVKQKVTLPEDLSTRKVIQNASCVATEAAGTLHHQTALAFMEAEQKYEQAIDELITVLEYMVKNRGTGSMEDDRLWQKMIEARHNVIQCKTTRMDLENLFENTEKLSALSAEISFAAGTEYSAISANERLLSIQTRLGLFRKMTEDSEKRLLQVEARMIEINAESEKKDKS